MINNRQNGRRRGRGGQQRPQGGSQGSRDSGNRIDSRARGNASQLYEKYKNMAADAQRQGDRVNTEYYLQFADHYFRVMADQRGRYEDQSQQPRRQQNDFDGDEEYGDEGEPIRADEQPRGGDERGDRDGNRAQADGNRQDGNRQYEGRQRSDRGDRQRYDRGDREPRREERVNGQANAASGEPAAVEAATATPSDAVQPEVMADAPKRRGRPRKAPVDAPSEPVAGEQLGFDSSALPPSIGGAEPAEAPKPRRRRAAAAPAEVTTAS